MRPRNPQSGISLLETMIALMIMAFLALMFSSTFGTGLQVLGKSGALNAELTQALARRDLRLWLEHALAQAPPDDERPAFLGQSDGFVSLVLPPGDFFWPGHATELRLSRGAVLTAKGQDASGNPVSLAMPLAPPGQSALVAYWGKTAAEAIPTWRRDWPSNTPLPQLVKISFVGEGRAIPPLTIRPAKAFLQSEMSLSSLVPPALPSRP